jgi:arylsulfatase
LPSGNVTVTLEYVPTPGTAGKLAMFSKLDGTARLYVNGQMVGEGDAHPTPFCYFGNLEIGRSGDSPVSQAYSGAFPFSGEIEKIVVDLGDRT